jgi:hypothetical protein
MNKNTYDVTNPRGELIGRVKAKDLYCAAKQARKKFWPIGVTNFKCSVSINRDAALANPCALSS